MPTRQLQQPATLATMAKTGGKRKADDATLSDREEDEDARSDARSDAGGTTDEGDGDATDAAEDDGAADALNGVRAVDSIGPPAAGSRNDPGSSGDGRRRSGRRKGREGRANELANGGAASAAGGAAGGPTPPRKRARRGAGGAADDGEGEKEGKEERAPPDEDEAMATTETEEKKTDDGGAAWKVPREPAREAAVAAEPTVEGGGGDDGVRRGGEDAPPDANGGTNGRGDPPLKLASQKLRLPSQRTPKPPPAAAAAGSATPGPPPPGGRRLLFESAKKKSTAAAGGGAKNAFLMQARRRQRSSTDQDLRTKPILPNKRHGDGAPLPGASAEAEEQSTHFPGASAEIAADATAAEAEPSPSPLALYAKGWFLFLLIFYVFGNALSAASKGGSLATEGALGLLNVRVIGGRLADLYGVPLEPAPAPAPLPAFLVDDEDAEEDPPEPEIVFETVAATDPALLSDARAALIARRTNLNEIRGLESGMEELRRGLDMLDGGVEGWGGSHPELDFGGDGATASGARTPSYDRIDGMQSSIAEKRRSLSDWERALAEAEDILDLLVRGEVTPAQSNWAMGALSEASMMPGAPAILLDADEITVPGEGCEGADYVPLEREEGEEATEGDEPLELEAARGVDAGALDFAGDAPLRLKDAMTVHQRLLKLAQATGVALAGGGAGKRPPSSRAERWARQIIREELRTEGIDADPPSFHELHEPIVAPEDYAATFRSPDPDPRAPYAARDAVGDVDRLLEIEDADRTGRFDYASVVHGAAVVRRGPFATSRSRYEALPLLNRVLARAGLRFYGHPPEAALVPAFGTLGRGQCWSFPNEFSSPRARGRDDDDGIRGEYGTLAVSLSSAITITDVVIEHVSPVASSDPTTAIKGFRVLGFEDGGAFGEPWELGTFSFVIGPTMQAFSIPTLLDGQKVPKLKSVAIAVDSNWGNADYACLYRVRVHGA